MIEEIEDFTMLHPGLYEQVINNALTGELAEIPEACKSVAPIDKAEASKVLAQYLADVVQKGLDNVLDNGGDISAQIGLTNQIVDLIQHTTKEADFAALGVDRRAEQLLALLRETDPRLAVGKTAADIERPETSIAQSSLFTGAVHEPQMFTELKKEIVSADRIDMLVSFIKWSGLRLIMDELREFTHSSGELRIITTSYMGATDVKAIEELRELPNTHIKVSYNTKTTRLHAKAYIFYRETGFTTAYVGSSNLSNAALTSGLEWNTKVTRRDLPETIDKIAATFEYYWNDREFEYYAEDQRERLARALKAEKYFDTNNADVYTMDINPYSYQQEILDKLEAERTVRGYTRNLVVAATGTGKTVISALDYKRFRKQNPDRALPPALRGAPGRNSQAESCIPSALCSRTQTLVSCLWATISRRASTTCFCPSRPSTHRASRKRRVPIFTITSSWTNSTMPLHRLIRSCCPTTSRASCWA